MPHLPSPCAIVLVSPVSPVSLCPLSHCLTVSLCHCVCRTSSRCSCARTCPRPTSAPRQPRPCCMVPRWCWQPCPSLVHLYNATHAAHSHCTGGAGNSTKLGVLNGCRGQRRRRGRCTLGRPKLSGAHTGSNSTGGGVTAASRLREAWPVSLGSVPGSELVPVLDALLLLCHQIPEGVQGQGVQGVPRDPFRQHPSHVRRPRIRRPKIQGIWECGCG